MSTDAEGQRFSVDIRGLLEALTDQFPEPLLCVRELVQNAADAGAQRIEVDVSFDSARQLFRLLVRDDGRGMNAAEVEGYLTIGFSEKDPNRDRGRFGIGKLSPYALGISRMVVETCDGHIANRLTFKGDGSGTIKETRLRPRGTVVRIYKYCSREIAEDLAERTFELVADRCGSLSIPLFVNGQRVNREIGLATQYSVSFETAAGQGVVGILSESVRILMGGGIVLETGAPILGDELSYVLDSPRLSPTLSRNAVRRDNAFDMLLREAQSHTASLTTQVAQELRVCVNNLRQSGHSVERHLGINDRAAMEWLRSQLLEPEAEVPHASVRNAPVLETADGGLVSAEELVEVIRKEGRVPTSRVPRTREEIGGYIDRGIPVLLLYRDLEDFLERQGITTVEVDGRDDGVEVEPGVWTKDELALAQRLSATPSGKLARRMTVSALCASVLLGMVWTFGQVAVSDEQGVRVRKLHVRAHGPSDVEFVDPTRIDVPAERDDYSNGKKRAVKSVVTSAPSGGTGRFRGVLITLAGIVALLSGAAGLAALYLTIAFRPQSPSSWLKDEAGTPLTAGDGLRRRIDVWRRAVFHPIDFMIARGWSLRASGHRSLSASSVIENYRELAPEPIIRSGVRLDLDQIEIGFIDLVSSVGEPHDGRMILTRGDKVLLNRNHPTVIDLINLAGIEPRRAHVLLEILLATDTNLARGTDPRQVEWDLLSRAERAVLGVEPP